jgi:hypothetical protein
MGDWGNGVMGRWEDGKMGEWENGVLINNCMIA